ncbi:MAG: CHAD domain-containing protein [Acidobacteriota bacterium]|nr:CHAD domain-containing protein [Acidobacteriota bacterium]
MSKPLKVKTVSADAPIQTTAVKILQTRLEEFYSHWTDLHQTPSPEQLHNLRISGKRLRYSAEQLRELFPDRLALLIELLKRGQDLLGEIQDCVTQRAVIETELTRLRQQKPLRSDSSALKKLLNDYDQRQSMLFSQFREIWMGLAAPKFRSSVKAMVRGTFAEKRG